MPCKWRVVPTLIGLSTRVTFHIDRMTNDPRQMAGVKSRQITVVNYRLIH